MSELQTHAAIFGEVLFDRFEDGTRVLGGAPFNVAWHLQAFGCAPCFVSRVGVDESGAAILAQMEAWGMRCDGMQRDAVHATGEVIVTLAEGEPSYDIAAGRAWDHIAAEALPAEDLGLLYHGTLGLRAPGSRAALDALRARTKGPLVLDVNLRDPFWTRAQVLDLMDGAQLVKLNEHELELLTRPGELRERARELQRTYGLDTLVVTRGSSGALALDASGHSFECAPQADTQVVDTVGAGDAFMAVLVCAELHGWPLDLALERAQSFASRVVGQRGATSADPSLYRDLLHAWDLGRAD